MKPPRALLQYIREGRCVLFVGSGLSASAGLPTWPKLLKNMLAQLSDELTEGDEVQEATDLIEAGKLLEVADFTSRKLGDQRYHALLSEQVRGVDCDIPEVHRILAQLPFAGIVTTNYDKLLERSYSASTPKAPTHADVAALGPLLFDSAFFILKAHGDIDRPDTIVLTAKDYQRLIHSNPAFSAIFSALLLTKAILFIGYSLNDPDFRLLLERQLTIFSGSVPPRYAVMDGVGPIERELLFRTAGIRVLPYPKGKHEEVLSFIQAMHGELVATTAPLVKAVPEPPKEGILPGPPASTPVISISASGQILAFGIATDQSVVRAQGPSPDFMKVAALMHGDASVGQVHAVGKLLSASLPDSIVQKLRQVAPGTPISLQISGGIEVLPWEWLLIDEDPLMLRNPLTRLPAELTGLSRGYPSVQHPARVLVIGDPNSGGHLGLAGAHQEARTIGGIYGGRPNIVCDLVLGPGATFEKVADSFRTGNYDIVHFAGHAWSDDEPFLLLSGEVKLHSSELRSLMSARPPAILFLNTHYSLFMPPGAARDAGGSLPFGNPGFLDIAAKSGVGALIGTFSGSLLDDTAQMVGVAFHQNFLKGEPVAVALHNAVRSVVQKNSADALFYGASGYGDLKYTPGTAPA